MNLCELPCVIQRDGIFFDQLGHLLDLSSIHVALHRGKMLGPGT